MNKLQQYKEKEGKSYEKEFGLGALGTEDMNFKAGFDKALDLNLPIKFVEWRDENFTYRGDGNYYPTVGKEVYNVISLVSLKSQKIWKLEDLYNYWIENILNI